MIILFSFIANLVGNLTFYILLMLAFCRCLLEMGACLYTVYIALQECASRHVHFGFIICNVLSHTWHNICNLFFLKISNVSSSVDYAYTSCICLNVASYMSKFLFGEQSYFMIERFDIVHHVTINFCTLSKVKFHYNPEKACHSLRSITASSFLAYFWRYR